MSADWWDEQEQFGAPVTDPTPLQERIARALNDEGWTFEGVHEPGDYDECEGCRRTVAPIAARITEEVAAEVRKAQADAWDEGVDARDVYRHFGNPYREQER